MYNSELDSLYIVCSCNTRVIHMICFINEKGIIVSLHGSINSTYQEQLLLLGSSLLVNFLLINESIKYYNMQCAQLYIYGTIHVFTNLYFLFQMWHDLGEQNTHMVKDGINPYTCTICGKRLTSTHNLQCHVNTIHKGIYPYKCTVCGRGFSNTGNLTSHMRHHTGERFTCGFCRKKFIFKQSLQNHEKICDRQPTGNSISSAGPVEWFNGSPSFIEKRLEVWEG